MNDTIHKHKYRRIKHPKGRKDLFMCGDPKCKHRINAMYLDGKEAACFYCGKDFIITREMLAKQGFLHCSACKRGGKPVVEPGPTVEDIERTLRGIIGQ